MAHSSAAQLRHHIKKMEQSNIRLLGSLQEEEEGGRRRKRRRRRTRALILINPMWRNKMAG